MPAVPRAAAHQPGPALLAGQLGEEQRLPAGEPLGERAAQRLRGGGPVGGRAQRTQAVGGPVPDQAQDPHGPLGRQVQRPQGGELAPGASGRDHLRLAPRAQVAPPRLRPLPGGEHVPRGRRQARPVLPQAGELGVALELELGGHGAPWWRL